MVFILGAKLMRINVSCSKDYPIILERGVIQRLREYISDEHKIMIITDDHVDPLYADIVMNQFTRVYKTVVSNGEVSKSFETYQRCERELLKYNFSRNDIVIALGGGVVGDLSGFVAATYKRGIDFYNIPTTTLSMVDSSIGGKVAINVDDIKNCVGAFYQPKAVFIDMDVLDTLTSRHYYNGLVEALKSGMIYDEKLFELFEEDTLNVEEIIYRSLLVKKNVVEKDEKETGLRKILNFGHTIGHAYESYYHLHDYLHGECVALGMVKITDDVLIRKRLVKILEKMHIDTECDASKDKVFEYIKMDKKADDDKIDIIKVTKIGHCEIIRCQIDDLKEYL